MPKVNGQQDLLCDGARLLKAVRDHQAELPGIAPYLAALDQAYGRAVQARGQKEALVASTQKATADLHVQLRAFRDAASTLRNFIKCIYGLRSEKLLRFGIAPIRKRSGIQEGLPN